MRVATSLTNQFLIAMPRLEDPNFSRTVTYICEHNDQGAMGIIINRPMEIRLSDVFEQLDIVATSPELNNSAVYLGGPVQTDRGFVLHPTSALSFDSTLHVTPELCVTTSRDVLEAIASGRGPQQCLVALGYAGWASGQLEAELTTDAWLTGPANAETLFDLPAEQRWQAAAQLLGVDLNLVVGQVGHA
ncbi:YqgE/AlgH family protein [Rhodoferax sp. 4810]|uniref:UPF0301 protein HUK38_10250 n=1 Tax=Thiospirillum jenense TaxID=1653858 RepID=A0A839HHD9_9GAMM|nr:YqgE/AlgH family protein [Thiospirillum jenense]MBB1074768.1 YqgE/AlgH family protein [Rhodoferax jenense]MBB1126606.1 YqgE/AlgH family protein [Thiospirillum jenense]